MLKLICNSPEAFGKLVAYAYINDKVPSLRDLSRPEEEGIWKFYRETIGYEKICVIVRSVTPEVFEQHYMHRWLVLASRLDYVFHEEGGLPRDNFLMQELDRISAEQRRS